MSDSLWPHESKHARPPCPSPTPGVHSNSCPSSDAIQPSHPLSYPSPPAPIPSQHQGLFQWVNSSHEVAKVSDFFSMNKFLKEQGDYVLTWNSLQGVHKKWSTFPTVTSKPAFVNKGIYVNKYVTIFAFLCMRKGRRQWHPTPVLLPGKSHGRRSLVGCSPWGHEELDTYWVTSLSLSCIGEGNGNPLQYSCLDNPVDRGAGGLQSMRSQRVRCD